MSQARWNSGETKPIKTGIYERHIAGVVRRSYFYRKKWYEICELTCERNKFPAIYQDLEWRIPQ